MTGAADWNATNTAFLSQALAWLRAQLAALVDEAASSATEPDWSAQDGLIPGLLVLRQRFGLSVFETKVLLLCAAAELDPAIGLLCARTQGTEPQPTFALCLRLFADPDWAALSPHQPLRAWRLVECATGRGTLVTAPLRTDERIVHFLKGLNELDERVAAILLEPVAEPATPHALAPSQSAAGTVLLALWRTADPPLAVLTGTDPTSKRLVAASAAAEAGLLLCRTTTDLLPSAAEADAFDRLWRREQMLLPLALLIESDEPDAAEPAPDIAVRRLLSRLGGPVALAAREIPRVSRAVQAIDVGKPTRTEQEQLWRTTLGCDDAEFPARLAGHFSLSAPAIAALAAEADTTTPGGRDTLWHRCRDSLRPLLDRLAQRIDVRAAWDDLVLPPDRGDLLRQIIAQMRHRRRVQEDWGFAVRSGRGLGVSALFAGESGTGKTFAAELLAATLGLDLYRIDLSGVVSKYIGETEKNLRRLFDAAEESGAILFFDEADALFGKRSEVRDSHDRYANIEVNYLLQRIEAYRGLSILATNLRSALDPAFLRRLRFVVTFPYPGPGDREAIWRRAFPQAARVGALDWDHLGRLNLTGGNIATVALNAAFLASAEDSPVEMRHVLAAARAEYVKLDRPFRESDFLVAVEADTERVA